MKHYRSKPASMQPHTSADVAHTRTSTRGSQRMGALILSLILSCTLCLPATAFATTASDLADAKSRYEETEAQLNEIAAEYEALSRAQSDTLDQIEAVQREIDETQVLIDEKEAEMQSHQDELAAFVVEVYKQESASFIDVLLESQSFESFVSNWEYISKINKKKSDLINTVRTLKQELDAQKASLESNMAELEELKAAQAVQMESMRARQQEVAELLVSLDDEVAELTAKNNAEIAARAAEAAAVSYSGGWSTPASLVVTGSGSASSVVSSCYTTPSPGLNWCAAWVTYVFSNAGIGTYMGNACDMYNMYCYSSDQSELQPGMIIAVSSNPRGGTAGTIYGHVGIYIGNGVVMENIGYIAQTPLSEWISWYSSAVTPRWGWLGGVVLD